MLRLSVISLVLFALALILGGCDTGFPDEEMHFGIEDKVRPYAVIVEPPDAAPGDVVSVTFMGQAPDLDEVDLTWRVALDYKIGQYGADEVERRFVSVTAPPPVADEEGFFSQTFQYTLPDSVHLWTSAIPEIIEDPVIAEPARFLLGLDDDEPVAKVDIDAYLRALTQADLDAMEESQRLATWFLSDVFACQIRFRARLQTDRTIDVTRNLTVRHTGRLGGPNTNSNAVISSYAIAEVHQENADNHDLQDPAVTKTWYYFIEDGVRLTERLDVPHRSSRTYYAVVEFEDEAYSSPYDPTAQYNEEGEYRWYYYREDQPQSDHHFIVDENGDDAEMYMLDDYVRLDPAGNGSIFRLVACVRDQRNEWERYYATPGTGVETGVVVFVAP